MPDMSTASKLIAAFVFVIIGVMLLSTAATTSSTVTMPSVIFNESMNIAAARLANNVINDTYYFTLANAGGVGTDGWVANSVILYNATGALIGSNNYSINYDTDKINFVNTNYMQNTSGRTNTTYADYQFYPVGYVTQSWGRTAINTNLGLLAIAIMLAAVGLFYSVGKDYDMF